MGIFPSLHPNQGCVSVFKVSIPLAVLPEDCVSYINYAPIHVRITEEYKLY